MPIANATTGNSFFKAVSYVLQEQKKDVPAQRFMEIVEQNNVYGANSNEIGKQMSEIAMERETVRKPVLHLQVNFHPNEKLNRDQVQKAIDSILKDIGIDKENHQYLMVNHKDKAHDHYHVVVNRVGMDGELINDHRIIDRLQVACDKVEKKQGLRPTQGRTVIYDLSQEKGFRYATVEEKQINKLQKENKPVPDKNPRIMERKNEIRNQLIAVLSKKKTNSPEKFKAELGKRGIDVQYWENKNGIFGVSFKKDNISIKGSAIGYKWSDLNEALSNNRE